MKRLQLSHGGGGEEMGELISGLFYRHFSNAVLLSAEDAAVLEMKGKIAFTTDCFTVSPIEFAGGDIGKIAVAGTVNDLSMMGARPKYLSCGFMIEEGLEYDVLEKVVASMASELEKSGALIVCGDTKVVPRGSVDRLFIATSGIGEVVVEGISAHAIETGDVILVSRDVGCHGATILASREGMELFGDLASDCETLWPSVEALIESGVRIKAMRDATRGGLSAVLNEWAAASGICIEAEEADIPIRDEVKGLCEMMGFEAADLANEGTFVVAVEEADAIKALTVLREFNATAAIIAKATHHKPGRVLLRSGWGSVRYLDLPKGELLPRIC